MNAIEQLHHKFITQNPRSSRRRKAFNDFAAHAIRDTNDGFKLLAETMHVDIDEKMRRNAARMLTQMIPLLNGVELERLQGWYEESIAEDDIITEALYGWNMCEEALSKLAGAAD